MKYSVLKQITRRSEGMKVYIVGSKIELSKEEAKDLLEYGFIKAIAKPKTKKNEGKGN